MSNKLGLRGSRGPLVDEEAPGTVCPVTSDAGRRRLTVAAPALMAAAAVLVINRLGPYISPDSVFYVGTARNVLAGDGLVSPPGTQELSNFPPLLPLVLAAVGSLGIDPLDVLRWLNPLLFGATAALAGATVRWRTGSTITGVAAGVVVVTSRDVVASAGSALSEPLFTLLAVSGTVVVSRFVERPSTRWFLAAAALVAAAFLTRYLGVAVVLAAVVLLAREGRRREAVVFGALTILPVGAWLAWAERSDSHLAFHPFGLVYLGRGLRSLSDWLVPTFVPAPLRVALAILVVAAAVMVLRRAPRSGEDALTFLLATFAALYLALLLAQRLFVDASGRLDSRFLSPLHVVVVVMLAPVVHRAWTAGVASRPVVAAAAALLGLQVVQTVAWVGGGLTDDGVYRRGYAAAQWSRSEVMARLRGLEPHVPVISNGADAVFLLTGRVTATVPAKVDYRTGHSNPNYVGELAAARADLERGGLLVYFQAITARRSFQPTAAELEAALELQVVLRDEVGTLYRL